MIEQKELPENWSVRGLGEVAEFQNGNGFSKSQWEEEGKPIIRIQNLTGTGESYNYFSGEVDEKYGVESGDILFAWSGTIDAFRWYGEDAWLNQHIYKVTPRECITEDYLYNFLKHSARKLERRKVGSGLQHIRKSYVEGLDVPVPPLDEQEWIVGVVEERLNRIERLEQSVENIGRLTEEYKDSLLSYLFTGRSLSQEKNSDNQEWLEQVPEGWDVRELREIGSRISSMTEPESGNKYSLYSFDSVDDGSGYYEADGKNIGSRKRELNGGEVMISRLNPRINRVQMVDLEHEYSPIASSEFVAIEIKDYVTRNYLYEFLTNPILQDRLTNHVTGSTGSRSRVGFDFVMDSKIPVPPESTQKRIVKKIREVDFSILERSRSDVSKLFDEYRNSVLSHAFRGAFDY